jgi:hypothetical protein
LLVLGFTVGGILWIYKAETLLLKDKGRRSDTAGAGASETKVKHFQQEDPTTTITDYLEQ